MRNDNSIIDHDRVSFTPFIMSNKSSHHILYVISNLKANIWWYTQMKDQINNNDKFILEPLFTLSLQMNSFGWNE